MSDVKKDVEIAVTKFASAAKADVEQKAKSWWTAHHTWVVISLAYGFGGFALAKGWL